ncbi:aldehyde ferredoxin oxidoreductase C-terminal domain-containing protein [Chloroflexota bacterium]
MSYFGYAGKLLYVDLKNGRSSTEPMDLDMVEKYIGGCGIAERMLCDIISADTESLSPENPIIVSAGPLIGTGVPGASKIEMHAKSISSAAKDQTKYYIPRSSGGTRYFGNMMKRAGYDHIVITGKSAKPVYLKIIDNIVEVCDATDLWGKKDIYETTDELTSRHKGSGVIAIGKAGENLIPYSIGWIDKQSHIGRNGGAAGMGFKNLKAIVVYGTGKVNVWDREKLKVMASEFIKEAMNSPRFKMTHPKNNHTTPPHRSASYYPPNISNETLTRYAGCHRCVFSCKPVHTIKDGEFAGGTLGSSFHYTMFGEWIGIEDYRHAMRLVEVCDRAGIDFRTIIGMLRFANRIYERGIINKKDMDGLELKRGNAKAFLKLTDKIINRDGIGNVMANGWFTIADKFGIDPDEDEDGYHIIKGTSSFFDALTSSMNPVTLAEIVNTKPGAELHPVTIMPGQTNERIKEWCRGIAMSPKDIDRIFSKDDYNIGRFTKHVEDAESVYWAMGTCVTWSSGVPQIYSLRTLAGLYSTVTGIKVTAEELKRKGEKIWNLGKLLNTREGINRNDDKLPGQWANAMTGEANLSSSGGYLKDYFGRPVTQDDFESMLDDYYDEHSWDISTGVPTKKRLVELGLGDLTSMLEI